MTANQPLRVVAMIDELADSGGTETQLRLLMRNFAGSRVDPRLVVLRGRLPEPGEVGDALVHSLGLRRLRSPEALRALSGLARSLRAWRTQLVWPFFPDSTLLGTLAAARARVPVVLNQRNVGPEAPLTWAEAAADRFTRARATRWVANSRAAAERLRELSVDASRIRVIPNAVETERFRPADAPERNAIRDRLELGSPALVIGCVANHRPVKGVTDLVRAFALLGRPEAALVLVGDGAERPALERLARELGVGEAIRFLGKRNDVDELARSFDIAVLPSHAEGSSNALAELQASGVACVATDVGGNPEALQDGALGLLVPPRDPERLASALAQLLDDEERRDQLARAGLHHTTRERAPSSVVERWEALFDETIAAHSRSVGTRSGERR